MITTPSGLVLRSGLTFSWKSENYYARLPFIRLHQEVKRFHFTHEDPVFSGGTINVRLYDEHEVDILESLGLSQSAETEVSIELRRDYGSGLYGPILLDGIYTLEIKLTIVLVPVSYGVIRFE